MVKRRKIIEEYKAHFGIQDIPYKQLGENDKILIDWAYELVNKYSMPVVGQSLVCDRVNRLDNNRCINCGAKAGHPCELQT